MKNKYSEIATKQRPKTYPLVYEAQLAKMAQIPLSKLADNKIYVDILIENRPYKAMLDSGSDLSFYNDTIFNPKFELGIHPQSEKLTVKGVGGLTTWNVSKFDATISHGSDTFELTFHSLPNDRFPSIPYPFVVGNDFFRKANLEIQSKSNKSEKEMLYEEE